MLVSSMHFWFYPPDHFAYVYTHTHKHAYIICRDTVHSEAYLRLMEVEGLVATSINARLQQKDLISDGCKGYFNILGFITQTPFNKA